MGEDVDALEAGIVLGVEGCGIAPFHEFLHDAGEGEGALVGGFLVVPVVLDDAEVGIAGPDQRQDEDFAGLLLVAQALELLGAGEHVFGQVGEAVDVHQDLANLALLEFLEQVHAADFFVLVLLEAPAAEEAAAGGVVLQVEDEVLVELRLGVDGRHTAGDEQHVLAPRLRFCNFLSC